MLENVQVLYHSSIKIKGKKTIYIDPYKIKENYNDADIIFITHDHYDHYSDEDIEKIRKNNTIIVGTEDLLDKFLKEGFSQDMIRIVYPNNMYIIDEINFETVPAYNTNKLFHPKKNGWVRIHNRDRRRKILYCG